MAHYDLIIAWSMVLFPIGLAIGLMVRHQRRLQSKQPKHKP